MMVHASGLRTENRKQLTRQLDAVRNQQLIGKCFACEFWDQQVYGCYYNIMLYRYHI